MIKLNLQQMHNDLEHAYKEKLDHVPEQNTIKDIHESYHIVLHFLQDIALLQKTVSNLLALQINPQLIPNTNNLVKVIQYRYDLATYQYQNKQITKDMYQQIHHNYEELNKIYGIEIEEFLNSEEYQSILATRNAFKILHINPFLNPVVQGSMITHNFQKSQSDYKKNLISKENFFEIENAFYFLSSRLFIPLTPQIISEFKALLNLDKQPSLEDALNKLEKEKDNMSPLKKQTIKNFIEEKFQNQQSPTTSLGSIIEPETKQLSTMPLSSMLESKTRPASTTSLDSMLEPEAKKYSLNQRYR